MNVSGLTAVSAENKTLATNDWISVEPPLPLSLILFAAFCASWCVCVCVFVCLKSFAPICLYAPTDEQQGQLVRGQSPSSDIGLMLPASSEAEWEATGS